MTINYLDSKRLQGLSSDIVNTPTFSDDYTTNSGWTQTGTTVTVDSGTADKLDFTAVVGNADHRVSKAIGVTLSDTLWICDYEINITAMGALTEAFPLFISAGTAKLRSTQDELGTTIYNNAGTHQMAITSRLDNSGLNSTYINISLSTLYYIRLERTSATNVRLNIFSDSGRTSHIAGSPVNYTINSGIGGLTTVQHSSDDGAGNANTINLTIDNLKIYDGVSSLTNKPTNVQTNSKFEQTDTNTRHWYDGTNWITQPTFEDDFTSYANQAAVDAVYVPLDIKISGDVTNDRLNYQAVVDGTNDSMSRSLGGTVSDTAWVLRFRYSMTARTLNSQGYEIYPSIGLSSADHNTPETAAQDGITFNPYQEHVIRSYHMSYADASKLSGERGTSGLKVVLFTETATVGDDYYIELKRTSATNATCNIYSNSAYTTLVETRSLTIPSTVTGLAYFVVKNAAQTENQAGSQTGWIDDIKFYNGVTSV